MKNEGVGVLARCLDMGVMTRKSPKLEAMTWVSYLGGASIYVLVRKSCGVQVMLWGTYLGDLLAWASCLEARRAGYLLSCHSREGGNP